MNVTQTKTPDAWVSKNKNRLKLYDNNAYYLNNKDGFELEFYNPLTCQIMATIYLNDILISTTGLVINPGQRVFLDRYLDVNKKFRFDTYEIENTKSSKQAIKNNGKIKIVFFKEKQKLYFSNTIFLNNYNYSSSPSTRDITYSSTGTNISKSLSSISSRASLETGRIGEGGDSSQKLEYINTEFESFQFHQIEYKILPVSTKNINDIRIYCTNCGTRRKQSSWKFCPNCGTEH